MVSKVMIDRTPFPIEFDFCSLLKPLSVSVSVPIPISVWSGSQIRIQIQIRKYFTYYSIIDHGNEISAKYLHQSLGRLRLTE